MLQQTRVETVLGYYGRWLRAVPGPRDAGGGARGGRAQGLGGPGLLSAGPPPASRGAARARAARRLAAVRPTRSCASFPGWASTRRERSRASRSGEAVPAADGNVRRVLARLFDEPEPKPAWLRRTAGALVDRGAPGDWNQAMMDLGATLCTPRGAALRRSARWRDWCDARAAGTTERRPASVRRRATAHRDARAGRAVSRRAGPARTPAAGGPSRRDVGVSREGDPAGAATRPRRSPGSRPSRARPSPAEPQALPAHEHRFTHLHARYLPYLVPVRSVEVSAGTEWVDPAEPGGLALPAAQRRILEAAGDRLGRGVA